MNIYFSYLKYSFEIGNRTLERLQSGMLYASYLKNKSKYIYGFNRNGETTCIFYIYNFKKEGFSQNIMLNVVTSEWRWLEIDVKIVRQYIHALECTQLVKNNRQGIHDDILNTDSMHVIVRRTGTYNFLMHQPSAFKLKFYRYDVKNATYTSHGAPCPA